MEQIVQYRRIGVGYVWKDLRVYDQPIRSLKVANTILKTMYDNSLTPYIELRLITTK